MTTKHIKSTHTRLALAVALSLGMVGAAHAVTIAGSSNAAVANSAKAETVTTGTITSIDAKRGVMAVSGKVIHFTPKGVTYSDDRRKRQPDGLEGLKPGAKVSVRSVTRDGGNQAVQIVVKD
jgi:ribosomal protein S1